MPLIPCDNLFDNFGVGVPLCSKHTLFGNEQLLSCLVRKSISFPSQLSSVCSLLTMRTVDVALTYVFVLSYFLVDGRLIKFWTICIPLSCTAFSMKGNQIRMRGRRDSGGGKVAWSSARSCYSVDT